jgi:lysozyme family protein
MYTQAFGDAINHIMLYEVGGFWNVDAPGVRDGTSKKGCGWTNDPTDHGGETKFGVAQNANPNVNVATLTWDEALAGKCDQLPGRVAVLHFDGCVNSSPVAAGKFLQRAVGVDDDGHIGPQTIDAVNAMNDIDICQAICDQRAQYYKNIVAKKPDQGKYLKGWLRRIEEMRTFTCDPNKTF